MRKLIPGLAVLLGLQLALAVGLGVAGPEATAPRPATPLIAAEPEQVDRLTLAGADETGVTLHRDGDGWRIEERDGFPADPAKVRALLDTLQELKTGTPVATSEAARERFKVEEANFERRLTLAAGNDTLATLWFGTTPSMGRLHVRRADEPAIHAVAMARHELTPLPRDWLDHGLLQRPVDRIVGLTTPDLRLSRPAPGDTAAGKGQAGAETGDQETGKPSSPDPRWRAASLPEGRSLNQAKVDTLARRLAGLRVHDVLTEEVNLGDPQLTLEVTIQNEAGKETITYRIAERADKETYLLRVSNHPDRVFTLSASEGDRLLELARRDSLLTSSPNDNEGADEAASSSNG